MKAAYYTQYGPADVFQVKEVPRPAPKENEVLVKVICTTVNRTDTGMTSAIYFVSRVITGLLKPKKNIPGTDFAGIIESVGEKARRFKAGDEVFGFDDNILSSHAEYFTIVEDGNIDLKPINATFKEAAASLEGAHYAINMIDRIPISEGDSVLVNGASGAIGSAAVQILSKRGIKVTAVANTKNIDLVKKLGAVKVFDYLKEDFTEQDVIYDHVLDTVGKSSFRKCKKLLKPKGIYISSELGKNGSNVWLALLSPFQSGKKVLFPFPKDIKRSMAIVKTLMEEGNFKSVIDREYPLEKVVEAYRYVASGQKTGNVILNMHSQDE